MLKLSVIDLGYNSIKLVTYMVNSDGSLKICDRRSLKIKIGEGLSKSGYLDDESQRDTIDSLKLFRDILQVDDVKNVVAVATSAVREARNRNQFISDIYDKTGFSFRLLSHEAESFYSWCGALHSTCIPDALFFDLGGGSLEVVHSENHKIMNHLSLSLGALRLTRILTQKDGNLARRYARKRLLKLEQYILKCLPERKQFTFSPDVTLVGVGGTLRTIAQYHQEVTNYPLDKIQNYRMKIVDIDEITKRLSKMSVDEISEISSIGSSRSDTVLPGCFVISSLMRKLRYDSVVVSTEGLREGLALTFINDPGNMTSIGDKKSLRPRVEQIVEAGCRRTNAPQHYQLFVETLLSSKLLKEREYEILIEAISRTRQVNNTLSTNSLFNILIDENYPNFSHSEQLVLCLSIVNSRGQRTSNRLFAKYKSILHAPQNKRSIERISSCLNLITIIEKSHATIQNVEFTGDTLRIGIGYLDSSKFPAFLFEAARRNLVLSLGVHVKYSILSPRDFRDVGIKLEDENVLDNGYRIC